MTCANADTPSTLLLQEAAEEAVLCLVNEQRVAHGVGPLSLNLRLRAAARLHAEAAKRIKWWTGGGSQVHTNPETGSTPQSRIRDAGYCPEEPETPTNENCYDAYYQGGIRNQGRTSPLAAVTWWMGSEGHMRTLLDPVYTETGVAVVLGVAEQGPGPDRADGGVIMVQTFGGCSDPEPPNLRQVWAWGLNNLGQLGDGTTTNQLTPVQLKNPTGVVAVAGGGYHSLALTGDGTVFAWGNNEHGQLGDGTNSNRSTPVQVAKLGEVVAVAAGGNHSLALTRDGTVFAWGLNNQGQLGDGTRTDQSSPVPVTEIGAVDAIAAGFKHSLAITTDRVIFGWGDNEYGQLGNGTTADQPRPVEVSGLRDVDAIAAGFYHSLALTQAGIMWAWGSNNEGQLGDSSLVDRLMPVRVHMPGYAARVASIAAGVGYSLALDQDGITWSWGTDAYGKLAHFHDPYSWLPVEVLGLGRATALAAGGGHVLALKSDGSVWTWGANYSGQLGDGTTIDRSLPVQVVNIHGVVALAGGLHHSLAL
jgi:alpha-tubulin suppressor-like RCC1 family protein/uncharacterized protein YkwD